MHALWLLHFDSSVVLWQRASTKPVHRGWYCKKMYIETSGMLFDVVAVGVHETNPLHKCGRQRKGDFHHMHRGVEWR